jgi:hypothetical protein
MTKLEESFIQTSSFFSHSGLNIRHLLLNVSEELLPGGANEAL